jgi:predicted nucleotide-binding protein
MYRSQTRRAIIADAVQYVRGMIAQSLHRRLATVQFILFMSEYDDKRRGKGERKEGQRKQVVCRIGLVDRCRVIGLTRGSSLPAVQMWIVPRRWWTGD